MTGTIAENLHEGSRSEISADYLFSRWGAVTPVRRPDDYGIDFYCTLTERVGQRAQVREYFTVQVKSTEEPWKFNDRESVRWLVQYPTPLFLCVVSKSQLRIRIYHVFPRFYAWALGNLPESLGLVPGEGRTGGFVQWENSSSFSLSAPIIEANMRDLMDNDRLESLRDVFAHWVRFDRENCDLVRQGLLRFRMPASYTVNETPEQSFGELSGTAPEPEFLNRGLFLLAEALQCIGGQLGTKGDLAFALEAALLLDSIQKDHVEIFENNPFWRSRVPGQIGTIVNIGLNKALERGQDTYTYAGLDTVKKMIRDDPLVRKYLAGSA
jgi:Domain of unknown function (DUF4365)